MVRTRGGYDAGKKSNILQILPIALAFLAFVFFVKFLLGSGGSAAQNGGQFIYAAPTSKDSKVFIYMSGDSKKSISGQEKSYSTDSKISVESGEGLLSFQDTAGKIYMDKLGEIQFAGLAEGKYSFKLLNAWAWAESDTTNTMNMTLNGFWAEVEPSSVVAFFQTAVSSNAYVLKGGIQIKTKSENVRLGAGQKITLLMSESADSSKLADKIEPLDDAFRTTTLFVRHGGEKYLTTDSASGSLSASGSGFGSGALKASTTKGKKIVVVTPDDEASVDGSAVDIEGKVVDSSIVKITFNDKPASIDTEAKTFMFKNFALGDSVNNVVYKAYDSEDILLDKGVMTLYSTKKSKTEAAKQKATVTTYPISSEKDFVIVAPTANPYKTSDDLIRIEGRVKSGLVKYITVEGFRLTKFTQFGTSWYYFANKDNGNLNEGINIYEIRYYDTNDNLLFKNEVKVVKESKATEVPADTTTTDIQAPATSSGTTSSTES